MKTKRKVRIHAHLMKKPVLAIIHDFPYKALLEGLDHKNESREKNNEYQKKFNEQYNTNCPMFEMEKPEDYNGIKLCYYKHKGSAGKWWIYYGDIKHNPWNYDPEGRITGSFTSKKKAIAWFTGGGR